MVQVLHNLYQKIIQHTYLLIWILVGVLGLATLYVRIKVIFLVNPDVGGIENNVIYSVLRVLAGYPLYQNPEQAPYAITQYSPIYYYLVAGVSKLTGLTSDAVYEVYIVGRCVSLLANFFYAWGILLLARRIQLPTPVSVLISILAFTLLPPQSYGRPDSLYSAFVIWTIWAVLRWNVSGVSKRVNYGSVLTALLASIALFSKQSALCLPIIVGGYLLFFSGKPLHFFLFLSWFTLFLGMLYVSLFHQEATIIYTNVIRGVNNGIDLGNFRYNLVDHYLRPFSWLVVPALAISIRYIVYERPERQFIGLATLGIFLFALATGLKWGSALNYFTEFTGLSCLLVADALWQLRHAQSDWANVGRLGILLGLVWVIPINAMNFNWGRTFGKPVDMTLYRHEQTVAQYVRNELKHHPEYLVYSTLYNSSYLNAFLVRNCIVPQQDLIIGSAYPLRSFDYTDLNKAAQDGRIQFVVSRDSEKEAPLSPPIFLHNYEPIKSLEGYTVYKFKSAPTP
ncbi:ArnT family glycosyltransferase [Spirosoma sp.]|uniref:ArnT family glycosyltransferase n=1 Tax=Spirosoma sp. TaxID=1899569 RepID=UPI003B3B417C